MKKFGGTKLLLPLLFLFILCGTANADLTSYLNLWWTMDANYTQDDNTDDSLVSWDIHNFGNLTANTTGIINEAITCGNNTYLEGNATALWAPKLLNNSDQLSVQIWFNASSYYPDGNNVVVGTLHSQSRDAWQIEIVNGSITGRVKIQTPSNYRFDAVHNATINTNQWYHVVMVQRSDPVRHLDLYVNGVWVANGSQQAGGGTQGGLQEVYLCSNGPDAEQQYFVGQVDEFAVWNRTLSAAEVAQLYNNGTGLQYPFVAPPAYVPSPSVSISTPADNSQHNAPVNVTFTVIDNDNATLPCDMYVDNAVNASTIATNNTAKNLLLTVSDGFHNVYINCTDGTTANQSATYTYYFDQTDPIINSMTPSIFNTTTYSGYTMAIAGNATNVNLTNVTRTIKYPNGSIFDYNETTSFGDITKEIWADVFNTTSEPNGVWQLIIYAEDSLSNYKTVTMSFTVGNCVPSWVCSGYAACNTSDLAPCNETNDLNACGLPYPGTPSIDFAPQGCNYCSYDQQLVNVTSCVLHQQTQLYIDNNFAVCCNVTQIPADCMGGVVQEYVNQGVSCSLFDYSESDLGPAVIEGLVAVLIGIGILLPVAALILGGRWVIRRLR